MEVLVRLCGDAKACKQLEDSLRPLVCDIWDAAQVRVSQEEDGFDALLIVCYQNSMHSLEKLINGTIPEFNDHMKSVPFILATVPKPSASESGGDKKPTSNYDAMLKEVTSTLNLAALFQGHVDIKDPASTRQALHALVHSVVYSPRLLWSRLDQTLTVMGLALFNHAFWVFDKDKDEELNDEELRHFVKALFGRVQEEDVASCKALAGTASGHGLPRTAFVALCESLISQNKLKEIWAMLKAIGINRQGLPVAAEDLSWIESREGFVYEPSTTARAFLEHVYKCGFPKSSGDVWPGWSVVPEGVPGPVHDPWDREQAAPVIPFKGNWEDGTADIFVAHWSYRCLADPQSLIRCCCYWGYDGDVKELLVPRRLLRNPEQPGASNVIQVLVLGGNKCGKTTLIQYLAGKKLPEARTYRPTKRRLAVITSKTFSVGDEQTKAAVVYHELVDSDVNSFARDTTQMGSIDLVLMVYDGSDPYSFSYLQTKHRQLLGLGHVSLPYVYVMTKCDLPRVNQLDCKPQEFVKGLGLSWPPVFVSVMQKDKGRSKDLNDIDLLQEFVVETARNPEFATPVLDEELAEASLLSVALPVAVVMGLGLVTLLLSRRYFRR
jgi:GTPase SAR1 family protein